MAEREDSWKNVVGGAIGGLLASWVMNRFMTLERQAVKRSREAVANRSARDMELGLENAVGDERSFRRPTRYENRQSLAEEQPTVKVANVISEKVFRRKLDERQSKLIGPAVHYAFGTLMGAWYGVLVELTPVASTGMGTVYGAAVWLGADQIALPALKLSSSPFEHPLSQRAGALAAHAVYGVSMDLVRRSFVKAVSSGDVERERRAA